MCCIVQWLLGSDLSPMLCDCGLDHAYSMNNEIIPRVTSHDYLGVTISHDLSWNKQCDKVHSKASRTLGLIRRTLHAAPPPVKKRAYEAMVRPTLEYASAAWSPHTQAKIKKIEQVQRSAARFIQADYRRTSSVTSMIGALKWDTLATRRLFHDATLFYQVHQSHEDCLPRCGGASLHPNTTPSSDEVSDHWEHWTDVQERILRPNDPSLESTPRRSRLRCHRASVPESGIPPTSSDVIPTSDVFNLHPHRFYQLQVKTLRTTP